LKYGAPLACSRITNYLGLFRSINPQNIFGYTSGTYNASGPPSLDIILTTCELRIV
jgi:hypothetical protein